MSALDAFSSPHGSTPLAGVTARGVAQSVLSLATDRPLPDQGRGIRRLYLLFDLVILALTVLLVISFLRIRHRYQRWRTANRRGFGRHSVVKAVTHFTLPLLLTYLWVKVTFWQMLAIFQPDLVYWLVAVAAALFVKGVIEITLMSRAFRERSAT
jgi:hypothetical protein